MPQTNNIISRFDVYNVTSSKSNSHALTPMDMRFAVAGRARSGRLKPTTVMDLVHDILLFLWFQ